MMMMIEVPKSWQNAHHLVKDVLMPIVQNNLYYTCNMYTGTLYITLEKSSICLKGKIQFIYLMFVG